MFHRALWHNTYLLFIKLKIFVLNCLKIINQPPTAVGKPLKMMKRNNCYTQGQQFAVPILFILLSSASSCNLQSALVTSDRSLSSYLVHKLPPNDASELHPSGESSDQQGRPNSGQQNVCDAQDQPGVPEIPVESLVTRWEETFHENNIPEPVRKILTEILVEQMALSKNDSARGA